MSMTQFFYYSLAEAHRAEGTVVVIDVLRAFTTAAFAFRQGASKILPVSGVEEALDLQGQISESLVMGEVDGVKPAAFDLSNSPAEVSQADLRDRILIQRTSAGTQGIVSARNATQLVAASFVVASATARAVREWQPETVSFIVTGENQERDGDEDLACGEFIQAILEDKSPHPDDFTRRVLDSSVGQFFLNDEITYLGREDMNLSMQVDSMDFFMPVTRNNGRLVMRCV
jgi:2-phosphosulfolactate phosphatase